MRADRRHVAAICGVLAYLLLQIAASAQTLSLRVENQVYAGLPFVLSASASGFEEEPAPEPPALAIADCEVTYIGVTPNISSRVQIINGQVSEWRDVTFVYQWRVSAPTAGRYVIPPLTVTQNTRQATSQSAALNVQEIETSSEMIVRMNLPQRPIWVGETFDLSLEWLLRQDVKNYEFVVPLFNRDDVLVQSTAEPRERTLTLPVGASEIKLPIRQDKVVEGGTQYTRFRFPARVTMTRPGTLELPPVTVAAALETTRRRNFFGRSETRLYKATGKAQRLIVRALPQQGRPPGFENAIGSGFSIAVQASRTVVQVGDPVDLTIRVRGDGPLEGLSLPKLDGPGALPPALFSVPDTATVGVIDTNDRSKTFDVTVRVKSAEAREIPPLAFAYFDPVKGTYATAYSQPIALSVTGSNLVGAGDVSVAPSVATPAPSRSDTSGAPAVANTLASLTGADMSLSARAVTMKRVWTLADLLPVLSVLYLIPLLVLGLRLWMIRTQDARRHHRETRAALRKVQKAIAARKPARDAAPEIISAMRLLARVSGNEHQLRTPLLERLETQAFDPAAATKPLADTLTREVLSLAKSWAGNSARSSAAIATMLVAGVLAASLYHDTLAAAATPDAIDAARQTYQSALAEQDRARRTRLFSEAERQFRVLATEHADAPALLSDWGNAALGAQDIATAVLAYRRALEVAPTNSRARKNLSWLRDRAPAWVPRQPEGGALDSLFFWHRSLSVTQRHLIGAAAFALGVLLLAPWSSARRRVLRRLAVPLLMVWMAMTGSALLSADAPRAGVVVVDGAVMRSADSLGAPPALPNPLPAGTELEILETRDNWTRIQLADGSRGWITASGVEAVSLPASDSSS